MNDELEHFYARFEALEPKALSNNFYSTDVIRFLKRILRHKTGLNFSEDDILNSVHQIITTKIDSTCPKTPISVFKKKKSKASEERPLEVKPMTQDQNTI